MEEIFRLQNVGCLVNTRAEKTENIFQHIDTLTKAFKHVFEINKIV